MGQLINLPISRASLPGKLHFNNLGYFPFEVVGFRLPKVLEYCIMAPGLPYADRAGLAFCHVNTRAMWVVRPLRG